MRLAGGDVLPIKLAVEIDGSADVLHDRIRARTETSAPHCVAHNEILMKPAPKPNTTAATEPSVPLLQKIGRWRLVSAAAALLIVIVSAGIYGIAHRPSNPADAACGGAVNTTKRIAPLVRGEVAALAVAHSPFRVPDLGFKDAKGRDLKLSDWRGRTVLLNLWATWCVPCRREMPYRRFSAAPILTWSRSISIPVIRKNRSLSSKRSRSPTSPTIPTRA